MSAYTVRAVPWAEGWELHVDGVGVTQVRTLDRAVSQVHDYVETVTDEEDPDLQVLLHVELGGLEKRVAQVRSEVAEVELARSRVAFELRAVTRALRERGLSVTDMAVVLGVTRGRISALIREPVAPDALRQAVAKPISIGKATGKSRTGATARAKKSSAAAKMSSAEKTSLSGRKSTGGKGGSSRRAAAAAWTKKG